MNGNTPDINGDRLRVSVERARAELRYGRAVLLRDLARAVLVAGVEAMGEAALASVMRQSGGAMRLLLTTRRITALGVADDHQDESGAHCLAVAAPHDTLAGARAVAYGRAVDQRAALRRIRRGSEALDDAALALVRMAQLAPALAVSDDLDPSAPDIAAALKSGDLLSVEAQDVLDAIDLPPVLHRGGEATVPLTDGVETRFVAYRGPAPSDEQVAVIIGKPDFSAPVTIRIHSACLTGDVFGSLRCDCGEQLGATIKLLSEQGGGVVLYLAQEGRGIGLANKLRAYQLQDAGADTYDANARLGFGDDERRFDLAAAILKDLGVSHVRLLTNNPRKVDALGREGVKVVDRIALSGGLNRYNAKYLRAKVARGGHFDEASF